MDLDHFKPVNDRFGHDVGDDVLKIFFQSVVRLVSPAKGEVYAWGGDEVVALGYQPVHRRATHAQLCGYVAHGEQRLAPAADDAERPRSLQHGCSKLTAKAS
jgi:diguanylate cyclase (GGDEF)-like protein